MGAQLWDGDPPEVWETAQRLSALGYGRHEILHMLGSAISEQIWTVFHEAADFDPEGHAAALAALPESWEAQRRSAPSEPRHDRAPATVRPRPP